MNVCLSSSSYGPVTRCQRELYQFDAPNVMGPDVLFHLFLIRRLPQEKERGFILTTLFSHSPAQFFAEESSQ